PGLRPSLASSPANRLVRRLATRHDGHWTGSLWAFSGSLARLVAEHAGSRSGPFGLRPFGIAPGPHSGPCRPQRPAGPLVGVAPATHGRMSVAPRRTQTLLRRDADRARLRRPSKRESSLAPGRLRPLRAVGRAPLRARNGASGPETSPGTCHAILYLGVRPY